MLMKNSIFKETYIVKGKEYLLCDFSYLYPRPCCKRDLSYFLDEEGMMDEYKSRKVAHYNALLKINQQIHDKVFGCNEYLTGSIWEETLILLFVNCTGISSVQKTIETIKDILKPIQKDEKMHFHFSRGYHDDVIKCIINQCEMSHLTLFNSSKALECFEKYINDKLKNNSSVINILNNDLMFVIIGIDQYINDGQVDLLSRYFNPLKVKALKVILNKLGDACVLKLHRELNLVLNHDGSEECLKIDISLLDKICHALQVIVRFVGLSNDISTFEAKKLLNNMFTQEPQNDKWYEFVGKVYTEGRLNQESVF